MRTATIETIIKTLNDANVRYLVVGGLAVVSHGYVRYTADIDIFLDLGAENVERAMNALASLGYRPRAPVKLPEFADEGIRAGWVREKGLRVFTLRSTEHPATEIDLFAEPPLDFAAAYERAVFIELDPEHVLPVIGLEDLLELKRLAGRPVDEDDIRKLKEITDHEEN